MIIPLKFDIPLRPCELKDIPHFVNQYANALVNTCNKKHGYILSVNNPVVLQNKIDDTGHVMVNVCVDITCFLPKAGMILPVIILTIHTEGYIVEYDHIMKIFVPNVETTEHVQTTELKVGDHVNVCLKSVSYVYSMFQCTGEIKIS